MNTLSTPTDVPAKQPSEFTPQNRRLGCRRRSIDSTARSAPRSPATEPIDAKKPEIENSEGYMRSLEQKLQQIAAGLFGEPLVHGTNIDYYM